MILIRIEEGLAHEFKKMCVENRTTQKKAIEDFIKKFVKIEKDNMKNYKIDNI